MGPRDNISGSILDYLNMFRVEDRIVQLIVNHAFNIYRGNEPACLNDLLNNNITSK